ncbi:MAG: response regulator [Pirellulales bacterium]|nr:response regulator [Pirellulales bacterium]
MLRFLKDLSITAKLNVLVTVAGGVALGLSTLAFVSHDYQMMRDSKITQLAVLADVLADNCTAALVFDDPAAAATLLASLEVKPTIEYACLFDAQGRVFAKHLNGAPLDFVPPPPGESGHVLTEDGCLDVTKRIVQDNETIGAIYVRDSMHDMDDQLIHYARIVLFVMIASLAGSFLLSSRLQRLIAGPILHLATTARRISAAADYSIRVEKEANDELGMLYDDFNRMLDRIQQTESELQDARDELELRVQQRTEELSEANRSLTREITEHKKTALELQMAKDTAERASLVKSEFLANMSHEIRTPITAMLGFGELLSDGNVAEPARQEYVSTILRNGEHLLGIINDILDLSKIEAGRMTTESIPTSPLSIVHEVISLMNPRAVEKRLTMDLEFRGLVPQTIHTDATRLRQILINLVGNAVKFTHAGGVRLVVEMADPPECPDPHMAFSVVDTGVGIKPDQVGRIFRPFAQADTSTTREFGGTGLGLVISRRFARMLGGDITVKSIHGKGTTFRVTVATGSLLGVPLVDAEKEPVTPFETPNAVASTPQLQFSGRILVAEDGPDNQRLLTFLLRRTGAEIALAENGQVAVEKYTEARNAGKSFDVILMDMQMPVMDGYAAAKQLREMGCRKPIIALTAHAMQGDRERCCNAGCDDYTPKPINRAELLGLIAKYAPEKCIRVPGASRAGGQRAAPQSASTPSDSSGS